MKVLIFSIVAFLCCLGTTTNAQATHTITCIFIISGNDYDCSVIGSFIPDDESATINIIGQHQPGRSNDHVTRVIINNSFHAFIVSAFFTTFPNLHSYTYSHSTFPFRIQNNAFVYAAYLRSLSITNTPLANIGNHAFQGASNLETITITGNALTQVYQFSFAGLANLLNINLDGNHIASMSESSLRQNLLLQSFSINNNNLTRLPGNLLLTNANLMDFQATNNNITEIGRRFLDPVPYLTNLGLENNGCINQNWFGIGGPGQTKDDIRGHLNYCFINYGGTDQIKEFRLELRGNIRLYDEDFNFIGSI